MSICVCSERFVVVCIWIWMGVYSVCRLSSDMPDKSV